jgi:feruloyl esterase
MKSFTLEKGLRDAREKTAAALDAVNPDLSPFSKRGGKLILYHGWNDPAIPALSTVDYYESVLANSGQVAADGFVRLYMLPGVQHCEGGPGPDLASGDWRATDPQHNARIALEQWVEKGTAPGTLVATKFEHGSTSMERPLCAYPQVAKYKGTGDPNKADSFVCAAAGK